MRQIRGQRWSSERRAINQRAGRFLAEQRWRLYDLETPPRPSTRSSQFSPGYATDGPKPGSHASATGRNENFDSCESDASGRGRGCPRSVNFSGQLGRTSALGTTSLPGDGVWAHRYTRRNLRNTFIAGGNDDNLYDDTPRIGEALTPAEQREFQRQAEERSMSADTNDINRRQNHQRAISQHSNGGRRLAGAHSAPSSASRFLARHDAEPTLTHRLRASPWMTPWCAS